MQTCFHVNGRWFLAESTLFRCHFVIKSTAWIDMLQMAMTLIKIMSKHTSGRAQKSNMGEMVVHVGKKWETQRQSKDEWTRKNDDSTEIHCDMCVQKMYFFFLLCFLLFWFEWNNIGHIIFFCWTSARCFAHVISYMYIYFNLCCYRVCINFIQDPFVHVQYHPTTHPLDLYVSKCDYLCWPVRLFVNSFYVCIL